MVESRKMMNLPKLFILISGLTLIAVSILGLQILMTGHDEGDMSGCPFMSMASICRMSPVEHISKWQSLFSATLPSILLSFAFGFLFLALAVLTNINRLKLLSIGLVIRRTEPYLSDQLSAAFCKGIIHSKIYNLSY